MAGVRLPRQRTGDTVCIVSELAPVRGLACELSFQCHTVGRDLAIDIVLIW